MKRAIGKKERDDANVVPTIDKMTRSFRNEREGGIRGGRGEGTRTGRRGFMNRSDKVNVIQVNRAHILVVQANPTRAVSALIMKGKTKPPTVCARIVSFPKNHSEETIRPTSRSSKD